MDIFIYRPDKATPKKINLDLVYTANGQNFRDWQRDREELYNYKVETIKENLSRPPKHMIKEWW